MYVFLCVPSLSKGCCHCCFPSNNTHIARYGRCSLSFPPCKKTANRKANTLFPPTTPLYPQSFCVFFLLFHRLFLVEIVSTLFQPKRLDRCPLIDSTNDNNKKIIIINTLRKGQHCVCACLMDCIDNWIVHTEGKHKERRRGAKDLYSYIHTYAYKHLYIYNAFDPAILSSFTHLHTHKVRLCREKSDYTHTPTHTMWEKERPTDTFHNFCTLIKNII